MRGGGCESRRGGRGGSHDATGHDEEAGDLGLGWYLVLDAHAEDGHAHGHGGPDHLARSRDVARDACGRRDPSPRGGGRAGRVVAGCRELAGSGGGRT